ncbi:SDR family NAD(P)-dependent oxidoreductase [Litorivivens sp.]|uniref:SDR family NAD(P)-dependent oxidoreductase n=1 Tax=Litorivivens sp. TaxID=2020868 RepID=UPI0035697480
MKPTALVTGCGAGLGLALAKQLIAQSWRVIATSRNADTLPFSHPDLFPVALDLSAPDTFPALANQWREDIGPISLLINNAGYGQMGPVIEVPWQTLQQQLHINVVAPLALAQAVLPQLEDTAGTVVNIGSVSAHLTTPFAGSYCASKSALHSLNDAMRRELEPLGIKVQCVMAGGILSNFGQTAREELDKTFPLRSRYQKIVDHIRERAELSQKNGSPAESVAQRIVHAALHQPDKPYIKVAAGVHQLYLLSLLPHRLQDRLLQRRFGLTKL